jgi:DNA invertase Pin-like site-specific DNA recombinase
LLYLCLCALGGQYLTLHESAHRRYGPLGFPCKSVTSVATTVEPKVTFLKNFVAYYRVSTRKQGESGLGLEAQRSAVRSFVGDANILAEFEEVESGGRSARPALEAALRECRLRKATLVIAKLDRLARSVAFISRLQEEGVQLVACDNPHANAFTVHILAAMAELERKLISERTRAALAAAKGRGVQLGGVRQGHDIKNFAALGRERSRSARMLAASRRAADHMELINDLRSGGEPSLRSLASGLNELGIPAPRGGRWCATQVRRVLTSMGATV